MRQCRLCGKGSIIVGHRILLRGHYNPTSKSRKYPNLQYAKVEGIRKLICVQCLKSQNRGPRVRTSGTKTAAVAVAAK